MRAIVVSIVAIFASLPAAHAVGSAEDGATKAVTCLACHGPGGVSVNPQWPSLAGQNAAYTLAQLKAFKSGARVNALMSSQAMLLQEQDMEDLAAYYAAQPNARGVADPALVRSGERLYRGGDKSAALSACSACHGPNGRGNPAAGIPAIAGQHAVYAAAQLQAYASGERRTDMNQMMRNIAAEMSAEQIRAVTSYVQGLRPDAPLN